MIDSVKFVTIEGILYNIDNAVISSIINYEYSFVKIVNIILLDLKPLFIVKTLKIEYYSVHYHAYIISETNNFEIIEYNKFIDNYPMDSIHYPFIT